MRNWKKVDKHPHVYTYEVMDGKRYGIRKDFYDPDGYRKSYSKSGFKNIPEAEIALKHFELDLSLGKSSELAAQKITLDQQWEQLKKRSLELGVWRSNTLAAKQSNYHNRLEKPFGKRPVASIKRAEYQNYINSLVKEGLAKTYIRSVNSLMMQIVNFAVDNQQLDMNRLTGIKVIGAEEPTSVELTKADYDRIVSAASTNFSPYKLALFSMFTLGARREEVLGLHIGSFAKGQDEQGPFIEITYDIGRTPGNLTGGPLKNRTSYRKNYARGNLIPLINEAIQTCKGICQRTHRDFNSKTFLFLNEKTGNPIHPVTVNKKVFGDLKDITGIEIRPHMMRHYFATHAMEKGLPEMSVAHWLGHKNLSMTQDYTRPTQSGALKVIEGMQGELFKDI